MTKQYVHREKRTYPNKIERTNTFNGDKTIYILIDNDTGLYREQDGGDRVFIPHQKAMRDEVRA